MKPESSRIITLGIETSCDETALALLETTTSPGTDINSKNSQNVQPTVSYRVLAQTIFSQIDIHAVYGGVFPIVAKREHARRLVPLLEHILNQANMPIEKKSENAPPNTIEIITKILSEKEPELLESLLASPLIATTPDNHPAIDQIAVTNGPGLEPALWVGVNFARALSALWNIPIIPTNHMEGHIVASLMSHEALIQPKLPAIALLISGGHTELVHVKSFGQKSESYQIIGSTQDDAIGEAYDKVARMMNIPYPGGPQIAILAEKARARFISNKKTNETKNPFTLPRPMLHSPDLNFSFSGLKTSVLYLIEKLKKEINGAPEKISLVPETVENIALAFEDAVTEVLVTKTAKALEQHEAHSLIIGGGVIANTHIREALSKLATERNIALYMPSQGLSGDNAVMIALAGALSNQPLKEKTTPDIDVVISVKGNLGL